MKMVATVGSKSNHGGTIISGDNLTLVKGKPIAHVGSLHSCPFGDPPHGVTPIVKGLVKTMVKGKMVATVGAVAGCGAVITTGEPTVFAE